LELPDSAVPPPRGVLRRDLDGAFAYVDQWVEGRVGGHPGRANNPDQRCRYHPWTTVRPLPPATRPPGEPSAAARRSWLNSRIELVVVLWLDVRWWRAQYGVAGRWLASAHRVAAGVGIPTAAGVIRHAAFPHAVRVDGVVAHLCKWVLRPSRVHASCTRRGAAVISPLAITMAASPTTM